MKETEKEKASVAAAAGVAASTMETSQKLADAAASAVGALGAMKVALHRILSIMRWNCRFEHLFLECSDVTCFDLTFFNVLSLCLFIRNERSSHVAHGIRIDPHKGVGELGPEILNEPYHKWSCKASDEDRRSVFRF